jgi:hypothetical protein
MDDFIRIEILPLPLKIIIYTFATDPAEVHFEVMSRYAFKMFFVWLQPNLLGHYLVSLSLRGGSDLVALFLDLHPMVELPTKLVADLVDALLFDENLPTLTLLVNKLDDQLFHEETDRFLLLRLIAEKKQKSVRFLLNWKDPELWTLQDSHDTCFFSHVAQLGAPESLEILFEHFGLANILEIQNRSKREFLGGLLLGSLDNLNQDMGTYLHSMMMSKYLGTSLSIL